MMFAFAGWLAGERGGSPHGDAVGEAAGGGSRAVGGDISRPHPGTPESFVGRGVRLVGSLHCGGDLTISGHVKGPIMAHGQVVVERTGVAEGEIEATAIRVRGRTRGTLVGTSQITLEEGGEHYGPLRTLSLVVAAGARLHGEVKAGPEAAPGGAPEEIAGTLPLASPRREAGGEHLH